MEDVPVAACREESAAETGPSGGISRLRPGLSTTRRLGPYLPPDTKTAVGGKSIYRFRSASWRKGEDSATTSSASMPAPA